MADAIRTAAIALRNCGAGCRLISWAGASCGSPAPLRRSTAPTSRDFSDLDGGRDPHGGDRVAQLRRWLPVDLVGRCELRLAGAFTPQHVADFARLIGGDLIAAGFKTTGGLGDVLFGTTTDRIVQHSECPVLVVNASAVREREQLRLAGARCTCDA